MAFRLAWVPPDIEREPERDLMKSITRSLIARVKNACR